jgi:hypothetical protein
MTDTHDITKIEWNKYRWLEVEPDKFIRGIELVNPPNDGFVYVEVTTFGDAKQRWQRAQVIEASK